MARRKSRRRKRKNKKIEELRDVIRQIGYCMKVCGTMFEALGDYIERVVSKHEVI